MAPPGVFLYCPERAAWIALRSWWRGRRTRLRFVPRGSRGFPDLMLYDGEDM